MGTSDKMYSVKLAANTDCPLTAILSGNDLNASETFHARLGFVRRDGDDTYRILSNGRGGELHLTTAVEGWLIPGRNPFGRYLYVENVKDDRGARLSSE